MPSYLPPSVEALRPFVDGLVLGPIDVHTAATFATADPTADTAVLLGAALAVRAPQHGSVCVHLPTVATTVVVGLSAEGAATDAVPALPWPEPEAWGASLVASPLVRVVGDDDGHDIGAGDGRLRPLVLDGDRLYLARYWGFERYVAADLVTRSASDPAADDEITASVEELFTRAAERAGSVPDPSQVAAAVAATRRRLVVIAGGPGTGKTTTVAQLLAGMARTSEPAGRRPRIALAAPTGKAAARMTEAIRFAIAALEPLLDDDVRADLARLEAVTIHRLLGTARGGGFWRGPDNPLAYDLLVVDEASMVSLSLMAHLLAAARPDTRVVLVGDPDQLASVEAGAVLGDLVRDAGGSTSLTPSIRRLTSVHRQAEGSGILPLSAAIREGRADEVVSLLRTGAADVSWIERPDEGAPTGAVADRLRAVVEEVAEAAVAAVTAAGKDDADAALVAINSVKVLNAVRMGREGVDGWNRRIDERLRSEGLIGRDTWHPGRPVMVTQNDYVNGVFNGDVGVALRSDHGYVVCFPRVDGHHRVESVRLDRTATQWAMSIHKSQGSEFPHAVVVLPSPDSRILTRELLYTGITRATDRLTVIASEAAVRAAVARPVARASGLADRLSTSTAPPTGGSV